MAKKLPKSISDLSSYFETTFNNSENWKVTINKNNELLSYISYFMEESNNEKYYLFIHSDSTLFTDYFLGIKLYIGTRDEKYGSCSFIAEQKFKKFKLIRKFRKLQNKILEEYKHKELVNSLPKILFRNKNINNILDK